MINLNNYLITHELIDNLDKYKVIKVKKNSEFHIDDYKNYVYLIKTGLVVTEIITLNGNIHNFMMLKATEWILGTNFNLFNPKTTVYNKFLTDSELIRFSVKDFFIWIQNPGFLLQVYFNSNERLSKSSTKHFVRLNASFDIYIAFIICSIGEEYISKLNIKTIAEYANYSRSNLYKGINLLIKEKYLEINQRKINVFDWNKLKIKVEEYLLQEGLY